MHVVHDDSGATDRLGPAEHRLLFSVPGPGPRLQQDLSEQFESVLAFADFCTYLTDGRVSDRAGRLRDLAQALHMETTEDLQRDVSQG